MNRHLAQSIVVSILMSLPESALSARASAELTPGPLSINVRVYNHARVAESTLERAKQTAQHIFRQAGVQMSWFDCRLAHTDPPKDPECAQPRGARDLVLTVLPESMAKRMGLPPSHFGYAPLAPKGRRASHAGVFFHKVAELARGRVTLHAVILGHIMAHETGHLLLGSNSHSSRGIMRAQWRDKELQQAVAGKLLFTPKQQQQMFPSLLLTLMTAGSAKERSSEPVEPLSLTVRTYNYAGVRESILGPAREVASEVFRKLGVQIGWANCTPGAKEAQSHPACQPRPVIQADVLNLKIISGEMAQRVRGLFSGDTFGFALPARGEGFGCHATVFYHFVEELARDAKRLPSTILGHLLAHEMGHLLLGMKGHSPHGIMNVPWGPKELGKAAQGRLLFVAKQGHRIRAQVRARMLAARSTGVGRP